MLLITVIQPPIVIGQIWTLWCHLQIATALSTLVRLSSYLAYPHSVVAAVTNWQSVIGSPSLSHSIQSPIGCHSCKRNGCYDLPLTTACIGPFDIILPGYVSQRSPILRSLVLSHCYTFCERSQLDRQLQRQLRSRNLFFGYSIIQYCTFELAHGHSKAPKELCYLQSVPGQYRPLGFTM